MRRSSFVGRIIQLLLIWSWSQSSSIQQWLSSSDASSSCGISSHGGLFASAFQWDVDTGKDDECSSPESIADKCRTDAKFHYVCSQTCTAQFNTKGVLASASDPDDWYDVTLQKADGKTIQMEDVEGYVVMLVVLPMYPGMTPYWFKMLNHIQDVFPYTLETFVLPARKENVENPPDMRKQMLDTADTKSKLILLQETADTKANPALQYILSLKPLHGLEDAAYDDDRVNIFLVSSDAKYIERIVHPSRINLEKRLNVYLQLLSQQQSREL